MLRQERESHHLWRAVHGSEWTENSVEDRKTEDGRKAGERELGSWVACLIRGISSMK